MKAKLIRIGNSRGFRIPQSLLELYNVKEGETVEFEPRRDGILMRPLPDKKGKVSWENSYREMSEEAAELTEWNEWDITAADGLND